MRKVIFILLLIILTGINSRSQGCLKMDILLVADLSKSTSGHELFIRDALEEFINRFELSNEGIKIGFIRFSSHPIMMNHLTTDKADLDLSLRSIYLYCADGGTNMTDALLMANNELQQNGRIDVPKMVVLISDGEPDPNSKETARSAAYSIKSIMGTRIFGVYVKSTTPLDAKFLEEISSEYCYVESDFKNLVNELKKLDICL